MLFRSSAQQNAAIEGVVSSEAEGLMEGVVVSARKPNGIVMVSVVTDEKGKFAFPKDRLETGDYNIMIRAVGYDLPAKLNATVAADKPANLDIKLRKARNLSAQLTNTEWLLSMPGTNEQKDFLSDCFSCHTLERIVRSTHDVEEWMDTIHRMRGYAPVSQPIKPQRMLDA